MQSFPIQLRRGLRSRLDLDAAKLVEGRALIQGASGSGKSYLARVIVEQTIPQGLQTIILDPEGEFITLREACDVLIAGADGDVPCEVRSAALLARRIAETGVSAVVDMSSLKLDERRAFVRVFLDTLDGLPKRLERPRLVVLDEAHKFCPESGKGKAESTEAVVTLMSQGRKRGLAGVLLTQRLSKLKKDAAAEANNVFIGRTSPIDLRSAADVLGITPDQRETLRALEPGEFYAAGPAFEDPTPGTFHAATAKTTHPTAGSRFKMSTPAPRAAIKKLIPEFAALPPPKAEEEAQSLAAARYEASRLRRELKSVRENRAQPEEVRALRARLRASEKRAVSLARDLASLRKAVSAHSRRLGELVANPEPSVTPETPPAPAATQARPTAGRGESLPPADREVLNAIAWWDAVGITTPTRVQVAWVCGTHPRTKSHTNRVSALRSAGYIAYADGGSLALTTLGQSTAEPPSEPGTSSELQAMVLARLPPALRNILKPLIDAYPGALSRDALAEIIGTHPRTKSHTNGISKLKGLGALTYPTFGQVKASSTLFVEGR
jgi:uncharacterized protein